MRQSNKAGRKKRYVFPGLILLAATVLLSLSGVTAARYVKQQKKSEVAEAQTFYFTSDLLKMEKESATYYVDPAKETFSFMLYNWEDSQRFTSDVIKYNVKALGGNNESDITVGLAGVGTDNPYKGEFDGKAANGQQITVTPAGAKEITVTATATSPYAMTLTATFKRELGNKYRVEDAAGNRVAALIMTVTDNTESITLTLPTGVYPDATDGRITGTAGTYTFQSLRPGVYTVGLMKSSEGNLNRVDTPFANIIDLSTN